jgi:hypothetical protein
VLLWVERAIDFCRNMGFGPALTLQPAGDVASHFAFGLTYEGLKIQNE